MSTISQMTTVPADLIGAQSQRPQQPAQSERKPAQALGKPPPDADQRLVIQEGQELGMFIYTIVDRTSGRVMMQLPREDVEKLASRSDYEAGQVVDTKV